MRYFRIPRFTGIEAHRSDVDRGVLRICEGAVPAPVGSLRSGPVWTAFTGSTPSPSDGGISTFIDSENNGYQMAGGVGVSGDEVVTGIHVNPNQSVIPVKVGGSLVAQDTDSVTGSTPYISDVGNNTVFVGTGTDVKKVTFASGSHTIDTLTKSTGYYQMENDVFPSCHSFVVGMNKTIFAAGDSSNPLRVYVSEPATVETPVREGVYSKDYLSKIDILCTNATKITALSTYQNYVVVHTDAGVVLLFQTKASTQSMHGFRAEQVAGAANSGAINPNVVSGSALIQPYYLGCDGQIWKDESARRGPDHKPTYSDSDQVSWKAKGAWNKLVATDISSAFSAYEPSTGHYLVGVPTKEAQDEVSGAPEYATYVWNDMSDSLAGPFVLPKMTCMASVPDSSIMVGVDQADKVYYTDLEDMRDGAEFSSVSTPANWDASVDPGGDRVAVNKTTPSFDYYGRTIPSSMGDLAVGTTGSPDSYYPDSYVSVMETAYEDFGSSSNMKQWHELILSFRKNSWGNLWVYAQAEDGTLVSGQYKGSVYGKENIKTFINLRGRRMKFRIIMGTHKDHPWMITEVGVGYLEGKVYT